jgi:hypothetical protein
MTNNTKNDFKNFKISSIELKVRLRINRFAKNCYGQTHSLVARALSVTKTKGFITLAAA